MKITPKVRKKYIATKFAKEVLPELDLTKAEKTKVEISLKVLTVSAEGK